MTSVPFPSFVKDAPVSEGRLGLSCVGKCRISPSDLDEIVAKNVEQAMVDTDLEDKEKKDGAKKLKKKFMKQGVAMAKTLLTKTLRLDPAVVDVEIVLSSKAILQTDGCVAACFLDAGCAKICIPFEDNALEVAKIPRERVAALLPHDAAEEQILAAAAWASVVSMPANPELLTEEAVVDLLHKTGLETQKEQNFEIVVSIPSSDDIPDLVGAITKHCKDGHGGFCLEDPTPYQLGMSYAACMRTDRPDGLYTTVVCSRTGEALGLVYSSKESVVAALECARGVYYSRSRKGLWRKGDTSGHYQTLHRLDVDCDSDALRFTVTQRGDADEAAFCHLHTLTCWGPPRGLTHLEATLHQRLKNAPEGSYTKRLFDDETLLRDKLVEEAQELSEATTKEDVAGELADVLYFAMVRAVKAGVSIDDAVAELDVRTRKVTRRKGDSKAFRIQAGNEILNKKKG